LAGSQAANFSRDEGLTVAENVLQANSGLAGVFAQNDEMALGAVEAARSAGVLHALVIGGIDAPDPARSAIA
jgi:ribose transport system substrate-binding protein